MLSKICETAGQISALNDPINKYSRIDVGFPSHARVVTSTEVERLGVFGATLCFLEYPLEEGKDQERKQDKKGPSCLHGDEC